MQCDAFPFTDASIARAASVRYRRLLNIGDNLFCVCKTLCLLVWQPGTRFWSASQTWEEMYCCPFVLANCTHTLSANRGRYYYGASFATQVRISIFRRARWRGWTTGLDAGPTVAVTAYMPRVRFQLRHPSIGYIDRLMQTFALLKRGGSVVTGFIAISESGATENWAAISLPPSSDNRRSIFVGLSARSPVVGHTIYHK